MRLIQMIQNLFFFLLLLASSSLKAQPPIHFPKDWTLLVITRAHCPHCEMWHKNVFQHWKTLELEPVLPSKNIKLCDAENDNDMKELYDLISKKKIADDIHSVPTFIVLDQDMKEVRKCRLSGYRNIQDFKHSLDSIISICAKEHSTNKQSKQDKKLSAT